MEAKRASGHAVVTALDIGAGSGLLSMMAARCAQHVAAWPGTSIQITSYSDPTLYIWRVPQSPHHRIHLCTLLHPKYSMWSMLQSPQHRRPVHPAEAFSPPAAEQAATASPGPR